MLKLLMSPAGLRFDRFLVRWTGKSLLNQVFARKAGFEPRPALLLVTTGRRSGKRRSAALPRIEMDGKLMIVGSKGGMPEDPYWVSNLRANPHCEVYLDRRKNAMKARIVTGDERQRLWDMITAEIPVYTQYQSHTEREIPVIVLEPAKTG